MLYRRRSAFTHSSASRAGHRRDTLTGTLTRRNRAEIVPTPTVIGMLGHEDRNRVSERLAVLLVEDHRALAESIGAYLEAVGFIVD